MNNLFSQLLRILGRRALGIEEYGYAGGISEGTLFDGAEVLPSGIGSQFTESNEAYHTEQSKTVKVRICAPGTRVRVEFTYHTPALFSCHGL